MTAKVAAVKCSSYEEEELRSGVHEVIELAGGIDKFVSPGQKVLLKVNLIVGKEPSAAVNTHPALVKTAAEIVQEAGGNIIIGDSPGGPFTEASLKKAYRNSGLEQVAQETGAVLNYNTDDTRISFEEGKVSNHFIIGNYVTEADVIINMPKLKTHSLTRYSGAVKNIFGVIPGLLKGEYHLKMPDLTVFSQMLLDLYQLINPDLNIMDAVTGMEGEGPSSGEPRSFGYIMASPEAVALDAASVHLLGINPITEVPLMKAAAARGLPAAVKDIEVSGCDIIPVKDVNIPQITPESNLIDQKLPRPLAKILSRVLRPRPVFDRDSCVGCGACYQDCPADAITMEDKFPEVDLDKCIRCFCCQEVCPHGAVTVNRPLPGRLLFNRR